MARRLGLDKDFTWRTAEDAIDYQLEPAGVTVDMLRKHPEGIRYFSLPKDRFLIRSKERRAGFNR